MSFWRVQLLNMQIKVSLSILDIDTYWDMGSQLINHIFPVKSLESNQIKVVANSFLAPLVNLNNDTLDTVISLQSVVIFLTFLEIYIILE